MKINSISITLTFILMGFISNEIKSEPVIVQPGSPGSPSKIINASIAIDIADTSYTFDDVIFLQQMIPHHQQAMQLSMLAPDRTNSVLVLDLAKKIESSQKDEILFMNCLLYTSDAADE